MKKNIVEKQNYMPFIILAFFILIPAVIVLALPNGRAVSIALSSEMTKATLVNNNKDQKWALFVENGKPLLLATADSDLVIGKTYRITTTYHPYPKVGSQVTSRLEKVE